MGEARGKLHPSPPSPLSLTCTSRGTMSRSTNAASRRALRERCLPDWSASRRAASNGVIVASLCVPNRPVASSNESDRFLRRTSWSWPMRERRSQLAPSARAWSVASDAWSPWAAHTAARRLATAVAAGFLKS